MLQALAAVAPVRAVFGNVDDPADPELVRERTIVIGRLTIHVSHGHELGRPTPQRALSRYAGDVVIFGHTHRATVFWDSAGRLALNPGAAGPRRFDIQPSLARLTVALSGARVDIVNL